MRADRRVVGLLLAVSVQLGVGAAHAQGTFSMTGRAATGAGLFVKLPAAADSPCPSLTALKTGRPTMVPQRTPVWDLHPGGSPAYYEKSVALNPDGCIPGGPAVVMTNGTGGFTFPAGFFDQPAQTNVVPVPDTPMVVQLATNWQFTGPPPSPVEPVAPRRNVGAMDTTFPYAPWAVFMNNAWTNQSGRVGPNFTACAAPVGGLMFSPYPASGAKVSCTFPSQGTIPGYVKNIAGAGGGFGGTLGLVLSGNPGGDLAVTIGGAGETIAIAPLQTKGSRPAGRGYAAYSLDVLPPGQVYLMYELTMPGRYGLIAMVSTFLFTGSTYTNMNWGFPWTTGNVIVRGTGVTAPAGVQPQGGSFSLTGFDTTTPMGQRNIQLVAGAVANCDCQGDNSAANYSIMRLPEPTGSLPLLAAALGLLGIAVGRARRARS